MCAFLGPTITSECILPCVENAIYDVEEKVVVCAVRCLTSLASLGLLSKFIIVDFTKKCRGLLLHPSATIRDVIVSFLMAATERLGHIDALVFLLPEISELLTYDLRGASSLTADLLTAALVSPLSRSAFRRALFTRLSSMSSFSGSTLPGGGSGKNNDFGGGSGFLMDSPMRRVEPDGAEGGGPSEGPDSDYSVSTARKLGVMGSYLDLAAAEINTKTLQWRNGMMSSNVTAANAIDGLRSRMLTADEVANKSRLGSLVDLHQLSGAIPEHALQTLLGLIEPAR